jgi:hypothetical protein
VLSRIAEAQTRVDQAQRRVANAEAKRDLATDDDLNSWDERVLEAKDSDNLMDHKVYSAKAKLQLAEITAMVDGTDTNSISLADAKVEVVAQSAKLMMGE